MKETRRSFPLLTPRLQAIADFVPPDSRVADVGTDHAYVPVFLVKTGICPRAIAGDIGEGPLLNARRTVEMYGVTDRVTTLLSPGLDRFPPEEVDTVVIAGMGGDQIGDIVTAAPWLRNTDKTLVLQPMSMEERCRRTLNGLSFACEKEAWVEEGHHRYVVMRYWFAPEGVSPLSDLTALVGTALTSNDPLAKSYLKHRADKLRGMLQGLRESPRMKDEYQRCLSLLTRLEEVL